MNKHKKVMQIRLYVKKLYQDFLLDMAGLSDLLLGENGHESSGGRCIFGDLDAQNMRRNS
jgi:hypothetical protein